MDAKFYKLTTIARRSRNQKGKNRTCRRDTEVAEFGGLLHKNSILSVLRASTVNSLLDRDGLDGRWKVCAACANSAGGKYPLTRIFLPPRRKARQVRNRNINNFATIWFIFSDLCGLGVPSAVLRTCFAGDTPKFGCGLSPRWAFAVNLAAREVSHAEPSLDGAILKLDVYELLKKQIEASPGDRRQHHRCQRAYCALES